MMPLILLAPSEDKAPGGHAGRLDESPAQRWVRERLADLAVHGTPEAQRRAFDVKDANLEKAKAEALALKGSTPLLPALARYQGVAFDALDAASLPSETWEQVFILSNLRGLVRGDERVPPYKLKLGGLPGLKPHWRKALPPLLKAFPEGALWSLLPKDHADLIAGWDRPRHTVEIVDGGGRTISHWSKLYRGLLARWILKHQQADPKRVAKATLEGCRVAGLENNAVGGKQLLLVVER
ncbi:MAG TPA: peroxide stress protein YaaA [Holophagaceae bacterium]|nr:peroxide stress protein YaaA [Holophagaceae bacterium]